MALIYYASIDAVIKLILIGSIAILWRLDQINQSPCSAIKKIQFIGNEWILQMSNDKKQNYEQAAIIISNNFFQLIEFTYFRKKKLIVLFCDQLPNDQLRLLHLKIGII